MIYLLVKFVIFSSSNRTEKKDGQTYRRIVAPAPSSRAKSVHSTNLQPVRELKSVYAKSLQSVRGPAAAHGLHDCPQASQRFHQQAPQAAPGDAGRTSPRRA